MKLNGLFIHGVGRQNSSFADEARRTLRGYLLGKGVDLAAESCWWAPHADRTQDAFLRLAEKRGSRANLTQQLVVGTLADALFYLTDTKLQAACFRELDLCWRRFTGPVHVFAHSLGGLIFTDWLRCRPAVHAANVRLVTLGCNIGLFNLGRPFQRVPQLWAKGQWHNLYDASDMLGFPLAVDPGLEWVVDREVNVGGWLKSWNGLSHTAYWDDEKLWAKTIPSLLKW